MKHKLAYIEAKALRYGVKLDDPFPFYRNFDDTYQICIRSRCPVDRVFHNCVESLRFYCIVSDLVGFSLVPPKIYPWLLNIVIVGMKSDHKI